MGAAAASSSCARFARAVGGGLTVEEDSVVEEGAGVHTMDVEDTKTVDEASTSPNLQVAVASKLLPVTVTEVRPLMDPELGDAERREIPTVYSNSAGAAGEKDCPLEDRETGTRDGMWGGVVHVAIVGERTTAGTGVVPDPNSHRVV